MKYILGLLLLVSVGFAADVRPPVYVAAGQTVTFTVTVDGYPTPTLEWFKDGVVIPGATSTTYVVTPYVPANHAGVYTVKATNIVGSATSLPETLVTATAPTISVAVTVTVNVTQTVAVPAATPATSTAKK